MGAVNPSFEKIFFDLKNCQKQIHDICPATAKREMNLPIQMIRESFALCSGAFYQLDLYHKYYDDLFDSSKTALPHDESWFFLEKILDFKAFETATQPESKLIKSEFRSMCIANAAFRLPSAGFLISDLMNRLKKSDNNLEIASELTALWKYHDCLNKKGNDWDRSKLKIKKCDSKGLEDLSNKPYFFLALLVCERDEYGHSEYHEDFQCRQRVVKKYHRDQIVNAEVIFLQETINIIFQLFQYHHDKKIDLCKKILK